MSRYVHLVSVGTSVLRNTYNVVSRCVSGSSCPALIDRSRAGEVYEALGYCADPRRMNSVECARRLTRGSEAWKTVVSLLFFDPFGYSAELNAMRYFIEYSSGRCSVRSYLDEVVLYHTDTHAGYASAEIIREFLEKGCGVRVSSKQISGLGVFERLFEGLSNLVREAVCDIERYRRRGGVVFLNLTGGLKPELGAFLLAGSIAGASAAYYIHEAAREPVFIPIIRVEPSREARYLGEVARRIAFSGERLKPEDVPGYAWILFIAESIGAAERLPDGSFRIDKSWARHLAEYINMLASPEEC